jgi:hypothetical protein
MQPETILAAKGEVVSSEFVAHIKLLLSTNLVAI